MDRFFYELPACNSANLGKEIVKRWLATAGRKGCFFYVSESLGPVDTENPRSHLLGTGGITCHSESLVVY